MIHPDSPDFDEQQIEAWSSPPIDGVGYVPSKTLLEKSDDELRSIILRLEEERYDVKGWRNFNNKWRRAFGYETTQDKFVVDYGCGSGVEALQYAKNDNRVLVTDIVRDNAMLARRVLYLFGFRPEWSVSYTVEGSKGRINRFAPPKDVDVFHACGVIHHIPDPAPVLEWASKTLKSDGEIRLMLYSDKGWEIATATKTPPIEEDVTTNPNFEKFTKTFDAVGNYADWYNADKIEYRFPFLKLEYFDYLCSDDAYCAAILKKK